MSRSATEVMQEAIFAAVLDAVEALKKASKGVPNNLLRDLNALHPNTGLVDTSPELQAAIQASIRSTFARLQRDGYTVSSGAPPRPAPRDPARPSPGGRPSGPGSRPTGKRPDDRNRPRPRGAPPKR